MPYRFLALVLLALFAASAPATAQHTLRVLVTDEHSGTPLPGASVVLEGTDRGTAIDSYGLADAQSARWNGAGFGQTAKLAAADADAWDQLGAALALEGHTALVGAPTSDAAEASSGAAYVFERQSDGTWAQAALLLPDDAVAHDQIGWSVALSGERALVSANRHNAGAVNAGAAYVFERQGNGTWTQAAKLTASDPGLNDFFGSSVALAGDRAVVGALRDDDGGEDSGSAYVFERQEDGAWVQVAKLTAEDADIDDLFGTSVALTGDRAVVGAFGAGGTDASFGAVYVYERQGDGSWFQATKLTANDAGDGDDRDGLGYSVALAGDRVLAGAIRAETPVSPDAGAAYVFERAPDGTWTQAAKLTAADGAISDDFGASVALAGDRALVGASDEDNEAGFEAGSAYVFERAPDGTWTQMAKLAADDAAQGDYFGVAVALSDEQMLVGAYGDDDGGDRAGAAYVFDVGRGTAGEAAAPAETLAEGALTPPWPNPVAASASSFVATELRVAAAQRVRVGLYDVLGRAVARLHDGPVAAGAALALRVPTAALAPGLYVVRAEGEAFVRTRRLVVIR